MEPPESIHPDQFLRSLFLKPQRHSRVDSILTSERDRRNSSSRKSGRFPVKRATTYPLEHDEATSALSTPGVGFGGGLGVSLGPQPSILSHAKDTSDDGFYEAASMASSRRPLLPTGVTPASTIRSTTTRPNAPRVQTDPTPLLSIFQPPSIYHAPPSSVGHASHASHGSTNTTGSVILPKALVLSGLENTDVSAQRALMQVLADRRLVLDNDNDEADDLGEVWNLPEDFFCVYVSPLDPSDRPPVLLGLVSIYSIVFLTSSYLKN